MKVPNFILKYLKIMSNNVKFQFVKNDENFKIVSNVEFVKFIKKYVEDIKNQF